MKKDLKIIDISIPLNERTVVYPGNPKLSIKQKPGLTSEHSVISIGSHTGTHVDAPKHVFKNGYGVDKIELTKIAGQARVLDLTRVNDAIRIEDLKKEKIKKGERILAKTKNSIRRYSKKFYDNYIYLDSEAARYLAQKAIALLGIDYLSVKQHGSTDNRAHTLLLKKGIVIFEGLDLSRVDPGKYFFVGLPLKFTALDGAPARAILIKEI